ncbi:hypothetical protein MPTK1_1g17980 [Marchantia polymorpha subsp. ruderalis]|uniref:Uncharacterized protein n=2 Tax=Marchantia polymorpha TaxID=3197 RepID=A0AAF6ARE0_MARPO|nr:hypothetical protein MARPO_0001s0136 [Marchantia polymorpha]BBM99010.1 hypothetical protein Mp_1g17980 [Marchantia polymorpha subsp. ruderalis]|eukprot:PTQ50085.1 hypothetical protein MARPO_0001s0136 [Marchantia polymorpha]
MGFGAGDVVGLIWSHPIASVVVALLFTPPLFPIVVFFSPLLISTALVVLAMISMGSDGDDGGASAGAGFGHAHSHSQYKRDWHEHEETDQVMVDDEDGPLLLEEERRLSKRRKPLPVGAAPDDGWLDKLKTWEETGRAWVDSVLHQESRKPVEALLSAAPAREVRFARPIPQPLPTPPAPAPPASASAAPVVHSSDAEPAVDDRPARDGEISSEAEEVQRSRGFPLPEPSQVIVDDAHDSRPSDAAPALDASGAGAAKEQSPAVPSETGILAPEEVGEVAGVGAGDKSSTSDTSDQARGAAQEPASTSSSSSHSEGKSGSSSDAAAAVIRERRGGGGGGGGEHHRTASVVVTLSEKLNVPLEDMMSLLAGDEKPSSSSNEAVPPASMKNGPLSHDEGWSSSDDEPLRAADTGKGEELQAEKRSS